ncbi:MAG TPA: C40 family peptidase, partial [Vicinamibacterales bacterium]
MAKPMFRQLLVVSFAAGLAACASTGHVPQPFPQPGGGHSSPAPASPGTATTPAAGPADAYGITGTALNLRGAPYRNGGSDPSGFDCSGFVWYVFAQHGVRMPRTVMEQARVGESVSGVEPGDLVFFNTMGSGPSHVGISIGGDEFIHA